ncbi:hypothetical protein [Thiomicrorhabdus xiamenensis]|uniref:Uncharacterized protein n=1 Tax=Thiomicrorhabdus xiamenensis TaxID=2739063 RepID=A0A7D4TFJ0_9GAMM|nr:hypothetical protein [Thiomicrorhabdus xiamenensis]QKI90087.1 hypothetical protein HQN79_11130 [Thiomicrorhabdus xiamenensis]
MAMLFTGTPFETETPEGTLFNNFPGEAANPLSGLEMLTGLISSGIGESPFSGLGEMPTPSFPGMGDAGLPGLDSLTEGGLPTAAEVGNSILSGVTGGFDQALATFNGDVLGAVTGGISQGTAAFAGGLEVLNTEVIGAIPGAIETLSENMGPLQEAQTALLGLPAQGTGMFVEGISNAAGTISYAATAVGSLPQIASSVIGSVISTEDGSALPQMVNAANEIVSTVATTSGSIATLTQTLFDASGMIDVQGTLTGIAESFDPETVATAFQDSATAVVTSLEGLASMPESMAGFGQELIASLQETGGYLSDEFFSGIIDPQAPESGLIGSFIAEATAPAQAFVEGANPMPAAPGDMGNPLEGLMSAFDGLQPPQGFNPAQSFQDFFAG